MRNFHEFTKMSYGVDTNVVIIRGANDILNSAYLSPIRHGEHEFPSVEHYCLCEILRRAGSIAEIKEVINSPNIRNCWKVVRNCVVARFSDDGIERADRFITEVKDESLLNGLRLRLRQDHSFRRALLDTGAALLAHCDNEDYDYAVGMDERSFLKWMESRGLKTDVLLDWFRRYEQCPCRDVLGNNKMGLMLMEIRAEDVERCRRSPSLAAPIPSLLPAMAPRMNRMPPSFGSVVPFAPPLTAVSPRPPAPLPIAAISEPIGGLPQHAADASTFLTKQLSKQEIEEFTYQRYVIPGAEDGEDGDWLVSDQMLALEGPFAVLSQYYPTPLSTRKRRYRSVEHYAYQKLFKKLKLGRKAVEKIVTTPDPSKLSGIARRLLTEFWKNRNAVTSEAGGVDDAHGNETAKGAKKPASDERLNADLCYRLLEFYERATKLKFEQYSVLKRLLVATGDSLLLETCPTTDPILAYEWTICLEEDDVQHFLTSSPYNTGDLLRFLLKQDKKIRNYLPSGIGRNRAGLALMRLRREYREANVDLLHLPPPPPTGGDLDENRLICFTDASVFHPTYVAPFWTKEGDLYASVQHFVCLEAAKRFGFPDSVQKYLADCEAAHAGRALIWYMYQRFPHPEQCLAWFWTGGRDEMAKAGSRLKFEKHPDLLRALLETGDAMLVYCKDRFQSEDTEWSIGFAEQGLRQWMQECRCNARELLKLCLSPLEARPAFLGGNRLGALLMEIRREFRLRGFQAHTLPKLGLQVEVVVGTGGECDAGDDAANTYGSDAVWPNPHFLLCKKRGQPILDRAKKKRKLYDQSSMVPPALGPSMQPSPAAVVASMGAEQLEQTAVMLVSKLAAMRKETASESDALRNLLDRLSELRDRVPSLDQPVIPDMAVASKPISNDPPLAEPMDTIPPATEQREKWTLFEDGLLSILKTAASKKIEDEGQEITDDDRSLFNSKNWDEHWVRSLVDLVWPHLTIRERQTALEWLRYTIKKLEGLKKAQQSLNHKTQSGMLFHKVTSIVPREATRTKWVMPQIKVVMTQKSSENESSVGARAGTPQSEGTTMDTVKCAVDWVMPETGIYPKILGPASP